MKNRMPIRRAAGVAAVLAMVACGDSVGVGTGQQVSLNFRVGDGGSPAAALQGPAAAPALVAGPPMVLTGTNGTLTLDEIRIVINEVELHRADGFCADVDDSVHDSSDECDEFEAGPRFFDLPLDGESIEAVTALIPAGAYKELDFEIEDLEDDEDDTTEAALIAAVRAEILSEIPDWPEEASAMVAGTFAPTSGDPVDFRVFLKAEIEIEFELIPNLVVQDDGTTNRELTVDVRPDIWFGHPDGTVTELHLYDDQLLEFEVEMEEGFTEIEFDD